MTDHDIREAHKLLDSLFDNSELSHAQIDLIRGLVPALPAQKTLKELTHDVYVAWNETYGNDWEEDTFGDLEPWLEGLHKNLEELGDAVPASLPAGMRLADHKEFGRVVVTDWIDSDNEHFCVCYSDVLERGSYVFLPEESLTFIDSKPACPEFLETEGSYYAAPSGTVVATPGRLPWVKEEDRNWSCIGGTKSDKGMAKNGKLKVLRWGWGN